MFFFGVVFTTVALANAILADHRFYNNSVEVKVKHKLFHYYDSSIRPVENLDTVTTVKLQVDLKQLIDLNAVKETLTLIYWTRMHWRDEFLTWNSSQFNLTLITTDARAFWIPDIVLYNRVGGDDMRHTKSFPITVTNDGEVTWMFTSLQTVTCKINIEDFPFDQQICVLKFGSWTQTVKAIDIVNISSFGGVTEFVRNSEWHLQHFVVRRNEIWYPCCPDAPQSDITFGIIMHRKGLYYLFNLIFPCLIITLLSVAGYWLPPASGEKVSLQVTCLLALTVFMLLIAESTPRQAEAIPRIGIFFAVSIIMMSISSLMSIFSLHLFYKGEKGEELAPIWKKIFLGKLATPFFVRLENIKALSREIVRSHSFCHSRAYRDKPHSKEDDFYCVESDHIEENANHTATNQLWTERPQCAFSNNKNLEQVLIQVRAELRFLKKRYDQKMQRDEKAAEWRNLTAVLERIFGVVMLITAAVSLLVVFYWPVTYIEDPWEAIAPGNYRI